MSRRRARIPPQTVSSVRAPPVPRRGAQVQQRRTADLSCGLRLACNRFGRLTANPSKANTGPDDGQTQPNTGTEQRIGVLGGIHHGLLLSVQCHFLQSHQDVDHCKCSSPRCGRSQIVAPPSRPSSLPNDGLMATRQRPKGQRAFPTIRSGTVGCGMRRLSRTCCSRQRPAPGYHSIVRILWLLIPTASLSPLTSYFSFASAHAASSR
jgi:hypothetical protein